MISKKMVLILVVLLAMRSAIVVLAKITRKKR